MNRLDIIKSNSYWIEALEGKDYNNINNEEFAKTIVERMKEAINYKRCSKELPNNAYEIDFGGHLRCGIDIKNNVPNVIGAINGFGNTIPTDHIKVTEI